MLSPATNRRFEIMKSIRKMLLAITIAAIQMFGSGCSDDSPPPWSSVAVGTPRPAASTAPVPATEDLVVYLDTSASMAGYVSPNGKTAFAVAEDGNTAFSKTLLELRDVVTTMNPQPR